MDESAFRDRVARTDAVDDPEPITQATLETLGEAVSSGQAADVADYLPEEYATTLTEAGERTADDGGTGGDGAGETHRVSESERQSREPVSLSRSEFVDRIRDRAGGELPDDPEAVETRIGAVADALQETIPRAERRGIRSQLPDDVESLFTDGGGAR